MPITWPLIVALFVLAIPACVEIAKYTGDARWKGVAIAPLVSLLVIGGLLLAQRTLVLTLLLTAVLGVIGASLAFDKPFRIGRTDKNKTIDVL